jgi:radical SAM-linked protein
MTEPQRRVGGIGSDEPDSTQSTRYRVRWSRRGKLRYLSANDVDTVLERSARRAKLPVAYSKGFTPHPKISFATALPVGYGSVAELLDMTLTEALDPDEVKGRFNAGLPEDLRIEGVALLEPGAPKLGNIVSAADYVIEHRADWLADALTRFMALETYEFVRRFKGEERVDDLRSGVLSATSTPSGPLRTLYDVSGPVGEAIEMRCVLQPRAIRPSDVVTALAQMTERPEPHVAIGRVRLLAGEPHALLPIDERGTHEAVSA